MIITLFPECVNAHTYITKRPLEMCREGHNLLYVLRRTIRIFSTSTLTSVVSTIFELKKIIIGASYEKFASIVTKIGNIDLAALKAVPNH